MLNAVTDMIVDSGRRDIHFRDDEMFLGRQNNQPR